MIVFTTTHSILMIVRVDQSSMDAFPVMMILFYKILSVIPIKSVLQALFLIGRTMNVKLVLFKVVFNVLL